MDVQIYLLYIVFLLLAYFIADISKSRINYLFIFMFSLTGFFLTAFYPAEVVTGTVTTTISPTVSVSEFQTEPIPLINGGFLTLFIMSSIISVLLWLNFIEKKTSKF